MHQRSLQRATMRKFVIIAVQGTLIGALAGLVISGMDLWTVLEGAFVGGTIGAFFGLRRQINRRSTADSGAALRADQRDA